VRVNTHELQTQGDQMPPWKKTRQKNGIRIFETNILGIKLEASLHVHKKQLYLQKSRPRLINSPRASKFFPNSEDSSNLVTLYTCKVLHRWK
jgi:hypothetical protein